MTGLPNRMFEMTMENRIRISLLSLRLGVFVVMLVWTLDKIFRPGHAGMIFRDYYYLPDPGSGLLTAIGVAEIVILLLFLLGIRKTMSYGLVLLFHTVSTITPVYQYASGQLLFYAALPMWAACFTLFLLRDTDTLFTIGKK